MKIFSQDRQLIVDMPRELWVTRSGDNYIVIGTAYSFPTLGTYRTEERAREVLRQIFEYHRTGKNSYIMPEE